LLVVAASVTTEVPWLPAAGMVGGLVVLWCIQRPSRWVYLLIGTAFLESRGFSLFLGGTRMRPAQLLLVLILALAALQVAGGMIRLRKVPLLIPLLVYLGCNVVSALFGPAPQQSVKIVLLLASVMAVYVVSYALIRDDPSAWPAVYRFFLIVGLIEVSYGLYQIAAGYANARLGLSLPIGALGLVHSDYLGTVFGRPYGTLPEPDTYGAVCAFYALLLGLMWLTASVPSRHGRWTSRVLAIGSLGGLLIGIVRAVWMGFLCGLLWAFGLRLIGRMRGFRVLRMGAVVLALLLAGGGVWLPSPTARAILERRFIDVSVPEQAFSLENARFVQMAASFRLFRQRPILGNGPGSFTVLGTVGAHEEYYISTGADLSRMYDPSILTTVLNDTGLVGAAAFVFLALAYLSHVFRGARRLRDGVSRNAALSGHCALVGLFASFVFTHYFWLPFTWLFLAMTLLLLEFGCSAPVASAVSSAAPGEHGTHT
jgi:hypothetical protein